MYLLSQKQDTSYPMMHSWKSRIATIVLIFAKIFSSFWKKCAYPKIYRTTTVVHESYLFSIQYVIQRLQLTYSVLKRLVLLAEAPYYGILFIVWDFFAFYLIIVFLKYPCIHEAIT